MGTEYSRTGVPGAQPVAVARKAPGEGVEWPTLALVIGCYLAWMLAVGPLYAAFAPAGFVLCVLSVALFSSIQHEVLHGHPFRARALNEALVFPGVTLFVPYLRFRDTHLAHHRDEILTDPYDDPESNYLDPEVWARLPVLLRALLRVNNTLAGRIVLGPMVSIISFVRGDLGAVLAGGRGILRAWAMHAAGVVLVLGWLAVLGAMPLWVYLIAAYAAFGILKIRTFLEHRAHEKARGRSVVVERGGVLGFLFLNNNLHCLAPCAAKGRLVSPAGTVSGTARRGSGPQ